MSPSTRTAVYLAAILGLLAVCYACSSSFAVGSVRERGAERLEGNPVKDLHLEPLTSFQSNDSPSPAWSPDGNTLVYSERYGGRMFVYHIGDEAHTQIYDANTAQAAVRDMAYNVDGPVFINDHEVLSGPSWSNTLDAQDVWAGALRIDLHGNGAQPFGANGRLPQLNAAGDRILLESSDGLRLTDTQGNELGRYRNLYWARWAPEGNEFVALQYDSYYGDNPALVRVTEDATVQRLQALAYEPVWHPDGHGVAFTRPGHNRSYFDPAWEYGTVNFYDFETGKVRPIADNARSPAFLEDPDLLLFDSMSGVGVSDLEQTRILRDVQLSQLRPSPNGEYLAGVRTSRGANYYPTMEVVIYTLTTD